MTEWTHDHQELLERFARKFPPPMSEADARQWTRSLAEQFRSSFPAAGWGTKRADPGRPPSTDCICTQVPFTGFDVIISQGQWDQSIAKYPEPLDLTGQVFIPVPPVNHLGSLPVPEPPEPPVQQAYPYPDENTTIKFYQDRVKATYAEAGRKFPDPNDSDAFRWFTRYAYDCCFMPEPESADKHIAELRQMLGLS